MLRRLLLLASACAAPTLARAQDVALGAAVDGRSGAPLACVEVALADSAGAAVATGLTDGRGLFQLPVPPGAGPLRVRFRIADYLPVFAPLQAAGAGALQVPAYQVAFQSYLRRTSGTRPDTGEAHADEDAWPLLTGGRGPRYPEELKREGVQGGAVVQFVVDTAGRVVRESIRPVVRTRPEFADAAVRFLRTEARFRPARRAGRAACGMLQMPFQFALTQ